MSTASASLESGLRVEATPPAAPVPPLPVRWDIVACALVLWGVLSWFLGAEWSLSEQYSYGWFVPFLAAALFWLRWENCPAARPPAPQTARDAIMLIGAGAALLALPALRLMEVANPEYRPLGWLHAFAACALTLLVIWRAGGWPWLRHLGFPVLFFLVAVPWLRGLEDGVIQQLMRGVASLAVEVVALFGIPAQAEGNLIRIGSGMVGVNEACSGVRSLQTSIMIGLLLGELNRFRLGRRITMFLGAVGAALFANAFRATYLVWIASRRGIEEVERQHDLIGYFILGAVFLGSLAIAGLLKRGASRERRAEAPTPAPAPSAAPFFAYPRWMFVAVAGWLIAGEIAVEGWYRWNERGLAIGGGWDVSWPEKAPKFKEIPIAERTTRILRFDEGRSVSWSASENPRDGGRLLFYFRWKPGRNSAQLASDHRPDVCLPAAGLVQIADHGTHPWSVPGTKRTIAFHHFEFGRSLDSPSSQRLQVFYGLSEEVTRAELDFNPYESNGGWDHFSKRFRVALAGRRNLGQQMIQIMLYDSGSAAEVETILPKVLEHLIHPRTNGA